MTQRSLVAVLVGVAVGTLTLLAAPIVNLAAAQDRPGPAAEFAAGWVGFADDGIVSESLIGGAARWYVLPRISLGPEVVYIHGNNHSHLMVTGNVTWDIVGPIEGHPPRVTPFLIAGAGLFRTHETFVSDTFASSEGAFTAGGGIRALFGDRVTVGIDTRVGWELHLRINGSIGLRLGR
jgi:hypothetical protein